jgi:adenylate kinase family enzyme
LGVQRGSQTKPVLNFYKKKVANISANKPMADVEKQIKAAMGSL